MVRGGLRRSVRDLSHGILDSAPLQAGSPESAGCSFCARSSVAERWFLEPRVAGSNPVEHVIKEKRMAETIIKEWCPQCGKPSFINHGNLNDFTVADIEGQKCPFCGHQWLYENIDEVSLDEANIEKGRTRLGINEPPLSMKKCSFDRCDNWFTTYKRALSSRSKKYCSAKCRSLDYYHQHK